MLLFLVTGSAPPILVVTLLIMCYLAGVELRKEEQLPFLWKAWWILFILLLNVIGFGIFWAWLLYYRRKQSNPNLV